MTGGRGSGVPEGTIGVQRRSLGPASSAGRAPGQAASRRFDTAELFGAETEIEITHGGAVYRLKITRQGKLILNK